MQRFETFKHNLDLKDTFDLKDVNIDKSLNFRGDLKLVNKTSESLSSNSKIPPLAAAVVGLNNTDAPLPKNTEYYDTWTDIDAQELYLTSKPTCFLIIGKPGVGAYTLGETISKKYNCIHLCPRNVIIDEIEQKTPTGKCLDFNMKHNKVLKYDTIFPIIQAKMKSPAVQHRGYVLSGLPLVTTSWNEHSFIRSLNGEEALLEVDEILYSVIVNLKKRKKKKADDETGTSFTQSSDADVAAEVDREEEVEEEHEPEEENLEEEEPRVELPKFLLEPCADMIFRKKTYLKSKKIVLLEQMKDIMNLQLKPDVVIHITCPDGDAIYKKQNTFLSYGNASTVYKSISSRTQTDLRWPIKCDLNFDQASRQDTHSSNSKYYCRQPMNFKENSVEQMCNFRNYLQSFIEWELKQFKPATIIKVDGCLQVYQMMYQISERLLLLPIKPVCIPEPMYLEDPSDDMEEFWQTVQELAVIRSNNVSFNRYSSPWYNRCPVELKSRLSKIGNPKFAVTFLKHVYLMATLPSMIQFCRNPRPYLKLAFLEPTCRVIVTGTKSSGKTMNSKCLEWIFDAHYIDFATFNEEENKKKDMRTRKKIFSDLIATVGDSRFEVWQTTEIERVKNLDGWCDAVLKLLKKYVPLLQKYLLHAKCSCGDEEIMGEGDEQQQQQESPLDDEFFKKFQQYREDLEILPFINDVEEIKQAITDKDILLRNAPDLLNTPTVKPLVPLFDDEDVTQAINAHITANDLQKDLEATPKELVTELSKILKNIDSKTAKSTCNEQLYGKWVIDNFPSDSEFWGLLSASGYMPDYTIALIENREIDTDLFKEYKNIENSVKCYEERFLLANDDFIKTKLLKKTPSTVSQIDVQIILREHQGKVLDDIFNITQRDALDTAEQTAFTESVEKFKENWSDIQNKIEESSKCHIVIELENKTDILITEEILLKLRQCYCLPCIPGEPEEIENLEEDDDNPKNIITFNLPYFFCDTNVYCPVAYYDHGVLWEGKPEYSIKYNNKLHLFANESSLNETFTKDVTKYQSYNKPFKHIPCLRICVMGCIGSGKTTIAKYVAKELGLIHVDFVDLVNEYLLPRHFKKIGRKHENSLTNSQMEEENAVDIQMGEENMDNLEADLLSNEAEFRRILTNYFELGSSLPSLILQKLLKRLWFKSPFSSKGFVLDGFPRMLTDVEDMTASYCIPDLIIDITSSSDVVLARVAPLMFKKWKAEITEAKYLAKTKFDKQKNDWLSYVTQQVVCKVIVNEIIKSAMPADQPPPVEEPDADSPSAEGNKMESDTPETDAPESDTMTIYNELVQEFPEPVDLSTWEKASEARERIDARIEGVYETDDGNIENLREFVSEQKIKLVALDNTRPLDKVLRIVSAKLASVRDRCESFFEQTFVLDSDVAESLMLEGFYFISKFNRMCPVHIFENPDTIFNPYKVMKSKGMIYTVAHRSNIYFIAGKANLEKFRYNPLKYIVINNIAHFTPYPLRFSVIGPPKCGKSTMAMKLAKKYGLICISKGKAIRHILDNMQWTELANKMNKLLQEGKCIGTDLTIKAVQTVAADYRTVTNGCVFDNLPTSAVEAIQLLNIGLYPLIIFDIDSDKNKILNNSQNEIYFDIVKYKPPYSRSFVENRFISWSREYSSVRDYVKEDIQNLFVLNGNESRWQCLQDATLKIKSTSEEVYHYLNKFTSTVVQAGVMCISNAAFKQKMSSYKSFCPVCLSNNVLRHGDFPVDKKGVLQYKFRYYWVCSDHMNLVLSHPECHLIPRKKVDIPEIPAPIKTVNPALVYANGICIVCYAENLPGQKFETGSSKFAAAFHRKTYLLCSAECLNKFLLKPQLYHNIIVFKNAKVFPELSLKNLPHIGYLEQTLGHMITEACCSVNVLRPKYPGLDIQLSALLYIALYLKTHNVRTDKRFLPSYLKSLVTYEARCKLMINVGLRLRAIDNPFCRYPICHHPTKTKLTSPDGTSKSLIAGGDRDSSPSITYYD